MHSLDLIVGPMYSAKSSELIKYASNAQVAGRETLVIRPFLGTGTNEPLIRSRFGEMTIPAEVVKCSSEILSLLSSQTKLVLLDEGQFFDRGVVEVIYDTLQLSRVVVSGLNKDFRGLPFGPIPDLMAMASSVRVLSAICGQCGEDACFSQRLTDGKPSSAFAEDVSIEGQRSGDTYEPRCHQHFQPPLDLKEWFQVQNRP